MNEPHLVLWAKTKPRHPLWKHLLDAAAVSLALPRRTAWSAEETALLVGLHDIGKADSCFQHQCAELSNELTRAGYQPTRDARCRHERLSARFIQRRLAQAGMDFLVADSVARCIVAHHGYWNESTRDVAPEYAEAQSQLCELLLQALELGAFPCEVPPNLSDFGMRLAGHVVLCDWIASNEEFRGDNRLVTEDDTVRYFALARAVADEWVDRLGLRRSPQPGAPGLIVEAPRPIQQMLLDEEVPPGLVIIEAPMGEGKTEAAWILAERWRDKGYHGMYMALPTMATSDSLHGRYRDDYLGRLGDGGDAKLVHGMAWLRDGAEPDKPLQVGEPGDDQFAAEAWFRPTRRAMLAAHGVGTVDQAMLAGMNVKFGFLRLYGLADRVLVIDEVHAYDAYMNAIIGRLLQWCACLKIPVILLSATLSGRQREALIEAYGGTVADAGRSAAYPLITVAEAGREANPIEVDASSSRTLRVERHAGLLGDARKTAKLAADLVESDGCCCVVLNTVRQAQAVYKALPDGVPKLLFHSRFTAADRERITNQVLGMFGKDTSNRPPKFVLVATQVVEQSLDVDFDHMVSEIAPIDLLLQRSGRMHRHRKRRKAPVLHILVPKADGKLKFGASEKIYQRYPLLRTLGILKQKRRIKLPEEFRPLIEVVYGDDLPTVAPKDLADARQEWEDLQEDLAAQAGEFLLCEPMEDEFDPVGADEVGDDSDDGNGWRARTRLGLEDVLMIPVSTENMKDLASGEIGRHQLKGLYQQSVKIPGWEWPLRADAKLPKSAREKREPALGEGKLRGVWLLPVEIAGAGWTWTGERRRVLRDGREEWKPITFGYTRDEGLQELEKKPKDGDTE